MWKNIVTNTAKMRKEHCKNKSQQWDS